MMKHVSLLPLTLELMVVEMNSMAILISYRPRQSQWHHLLMVSFIIKLWCFNWSRYCSFYSYIFKLNVFVNKLMDKPFSSFFLIHNLYMLLRLCIAWIWGSWSLHPLLVLYIVNKWGYNLIVFVLIICQSYKCSMIHHCIITSCIQKI